MAAAPHASPPGRRGTATHGRRRATVLLAAIVAVVGLTAAAFPTSATTASVATVGFQGESGTIQDVDARTGQLAPTAEQQAIAERLHADVRWNRFATPHSLFNPDGWLATGLTGDPVAAARQFLSDNRALFRLSEAGLANLEVINDSPLGDSGAHVVLFRQRFGDLTPAEDGMAAIGVSDGRIAYVSSSIAGDGATPPAATLSPVAAWRIAAADVGRPVAAADIAAPVTKGGWQVLRVDGYAQPQRARLRALPLADGSVRPVFETVVLDNSPGLAAPLAVTHLVDAVTGEVLVRRNRVDYLAAPDGGAFQGTTGQNGACGPNHEFEVGPDAKSIDVAASANVPADDIIVNLVHDGEVVATFDSLYSPEAVHYAPSVIDPGTYAAQVCAYDATAEPFDYAGTYAVSPVGASGMPYPPMWSVFPANPPVDHSPTDTRELWCWESSVDGVPLPGCDREVRNDAARAPWDVDPHTGLPTFTTIGNAAKSAVAWFAPDTVAAGAITPGENYSPPAPDRRYDFPWTNQWNESKCDPSSFASPSRNDADAAAVNLFKAHNSMHDFAYRLGFTEQNYNMQASNYGNTQPGPYPVGREDDLEVGNVQAGGATGGWPTFGGRDNANQLTLQDGIPGITNMYLWQPIAGIFYSPCVDGDLDMSVVGHEYTHAISNRMVGGPDAGLTGLQAGSMGESWSDLDALEYLHAYGLVPTADENPWSAGAYVTGDKEAGIRNWPLDTNPLNYSDMGYDLTGPEVHADGEIWNGIQFGVRQALVDAYDAPFPSTDQALQERCADGELPADQCPGNRRWIQLVYDAWLLMPPDVSMVDARDAMLAADLLRFDGANQDTLWDAFAKGGLGQGAASDTTDDDQPTPSFASKTSRNVSVTFAPQADKHTPISDAQVYVGRFEARVSPIADTDPETELTDTADLVPGTYEFVIQAPGYGLTRVTATLDAKDAKKDKGVTLTVPLRRNLASISNGATVTGDGVNLDEIADDTESTNWASLDGVKGKQVTIDLAGDDAQTVAEVDVSAMLRPDTGDEEDSGSQNRFTALRSFELQACDATTGADCSSADGFSTVYTSAPDAFDGHKPRPRVPDLTLRPFTLDHEVHATHLRIVVTDSQCTGGPDFQGEQDNDPRNATDCDEGDAGPLIGSNGTTVRIAEVQVYGRDRKEAKQRR